MHRGASCLVLFGFLLFGSPAGAVLPGRQVLQEQSQDPSQEQSREEPSFEEEITVALSTAVLRVVDTWGRPILGLKPEDFRVRVGKIDVPVVGVDWIAAGKPDASAAPPAAERTGEVFVEDAADTAPAPLPNRLLVFFVQTDLNPSRISGQLRLRRYVKELLETLQPSDRMAVVSYDSHLKLWQDFTPDRDAVHAAIDRAMLWSAEREVAPGDPVSLATNLDPAEALKAASPEKALQLMAGALKPLPGEKTVIYLGWGFGRFGKGGPQLSVRHQPTMKALTDAKASVFVLDVTSADYHSLEIGLQSMAAATGGMYLRTFRLPQLATQTLAQTISGYYVLTFDPSSLTPKDGQLQIELRNNKQGTVLARPAALR
jgi:VWFA-related protein